MLLSGTPNHFQVAGATVAATRLRPRNSAVTSSSAAPQHNFAVTTPTKLRRAKRVTPRQSASLCCCCGLRNPAAPSASLHSTPRITLQMLLLRISAMPSMLLCGLAGSGLVLYAIAPPHMTFTFIPSTPPISLSFNFSFQLNWPAGSDSLNISPRARWVVCPPGRTRGRGPRIKSPADSRIQQKNFKEDSRLSQKRLLQ